MACTVTEPPAEFTKSRVTPRGLPSGSVTTIGSVFPDGTVIVVSVICELFSLASPSASAFSLANLSASAFSLANLSAYALSLANLSD